MKEKRHRERDLTDVEIKAIDKTCQNQCRKATSYYYCYVGLLLPNLQTVRDKGRVIKLGEKQL